MSEMKETREDCVVQDEAVFKWPEKRCYTVEDLQNILMCSKGTVYELLKKKEFRYIRLGKGGYRISRKSFDDWLDQ